MLATICDQSLKTYHLATHMGQIQIFHRVCNETLQNKVIQNNCRNTFGWLMDVSYKYTKPYINMHVLDMRVVMYIKN